MKPNTIIVAFFSLIIAIYLALHKGYFSALNPIFDYVIIILIVGLGVFSVYKETRMKVKLILLGIILTGISLGFIGANLISN